MSEKQTAILKAHWLTCRTNIVSFLAVVWLCVVLSGCQRPPIEQVKQQVHLGMPRDEAITIMLVKLESWYHQPCLNKETISDLFFFGSQSYDKAEIVILSSELKGTSYKVFHIGTFETYAWHTAYKDCYQEDKFIYTD